MRATSAARRSIGRAIGRGLEAAHIGDDAGDTIAAHHGYMLLGLTRAAMKIGAAAGPRRMILARRADLMPSPADFKRSPLITLCCPSMRWRLVAHASLDARSPPPARCTGFTRLLRWTVEKSDYYFTHLRSVGLSASRKQRLLGSSSAKCRMMFASRRATAYKAGRCCLHEVMGLNSSSSAASTRYWRLSGNPAQLLRGFLRAISSCGYTVVGPDDMIYTFSTPIFLLRPYVSVYFNKTAAARIAV